MQEDLTTRQVTGTNMTGGKTYTQTAFKGRLEWQRTRVINAIGEEATSEAVIFTTYRLKPGDLVVIEGRDWTVQTVTQRKGLYGGQTDHWEVRL